MPCLLQWDDKDLRLWVRVQTRASKDEILGPQGEAIRVRIRAAPVDGKANRHLQKMMAKAFAVPQSQVLIEQGVSSPSKRIRICSPRRLPEPLRPLLEELRDV